jgi:hypothetical protein
LSVFYSRPSLQILPLIASDRVFGEDATTHELFDVAVKDLITSVVDGYNATVFAYGQTAAGKTHTMLGSKGTPGVLPLAVNEIMESISRATHRAFLIRCSYIEIYKEQITDLLGKKTLEVHESKSKVRARWAAQSFESAHDPPLTPRALPTPPPASRRSFTLMLLRRLFRRPMISLQPLVAVKKRVTLAERA